MIPGEFAPVIRGPVAAGWVHVVKKHDASDRQLWEPRREIMPHGFIGVKSVNVQQINGTVTELPQGVVKEAAMETDL